MISFVLEFPERPWTTNAERSGNRWDRAKKTKYWRQGFHYLALEQQIPKLQWCEITAEPWLKNRSGMQDTGACHPAVKAAIDGIVDSGIIEEDTPDIVRAITYVYPKVGRDGLLLIVKGEPA